MLRCLHHTVKKVVLIGFKKGFFVILSLIIVIVVDGCGRAYFPIELKTISRSKRAESQETNSIKIVAMTSRAIEKANLRPYQRRVINAGNLEQPAKIVFAEDALKEKFPKENDPGPYRIGIGDVISFGQIFNQNDIRSLVKRDVVVKENQRGKGIGKLLVNTLIEKAKKNNCDKIILSSSEKNLKFYKKLGFQKNEFEMIMRI